MGYFAVNYPPLDVSESRYKHKKQKETSKVLS